MSDFTFTIYTEPIKEGSWKWKDRTKDRERATKALTYLGPWCLTCGKKGNDCAGKQVAKCNERRWNALVRRHAGCGLSVHEQAQEYKRAQKLNETDAQYAQRQANEKEALLSRYAA